MITYRDLRETIECPWCDGTMVHIQSIPSHPITDENATWISSHMDVIGDSVDNKKRPVTTRKAFKKYLKDNNLRPKKSAWDNVREV